MLQIPVDTEDWPENVWHRQHNPNKRDVRKCTPLLPLPELRAAIPARGTAFGFAGVVKGFLFRRGCIDLATKYRCSTVTDALEVLPNSRTSLWPVPFRPGQFQDLP